MEKFTSKILRPVIFILEKLNIIPTPDAAAIVTPIVIATTQQNNDLPKSETTIDYTYDDKRW